MAAVYANHYAGEDYFIWTLLQVNLVSVVQLPA